MKTLRKASYWEWNREAYALLAFALGFLPFMAYSTDVWIALLGESTAGVIATLVSWGVYAIAMLAWYAYYMERAHAQERRLLSFNRAWRHYTSPTE